MKLILSIIAVFFVQGLQAQKVFIGDKEGNRPLVWSDFTGKPDESSSYNALTFWSIKYNVSNVQFKGDEMTIGKFEVILTFSSNNSWLKKGKGTEALLEHEQGHFNTSILCMNELLKKVKETTFTKKNINEKLQAIFNDTMKKYHELGLLYDEESNHSINVEQQAKWNKFFKQQMAL